VLAVDDSLTYREALGSELRQQGYDVVLAKSGEQALELLELRAPDCILLDCVMPGLSGQETCRRIKQRPEWRDIPLVMLTAKDDREAMIDGLNAGADDYIAKSPDFEVLSVRLRAQLRRKQFEDENRTIREALVRQKAEEIARQKSEVEQKKVDRLLRERNVELEVARDVAEKANRAKSEFLSAMSHELRTPLNAILGFAQLIESDTPPPSASHAASLAQIIQAGWHLLKLISEILDLAKVESGQVPLSAEAVSLPEVLGECLALILPQAQQRGLRILPAPVASPFLVLADRTRLTQVLLNLLSNAVKYNRPEGTIEVAFREGLGKGLDEQPGGGVRVSVRDTGAGLSPGQVAQLFQSFNRLAQEQGTEEGTGIGLVVCKRLVELMGGAIGVDSTEGVGSVFWFELPRAPLAEAADPAADPTAVGADLAEGHRGALAGPGRADAPGRRQRTVLYVEDNPANTLLVAQLLARTPALKLLSATDGLQGVALARAALPDVILMDISLPGISGLDALALLRADPATARIPVVAVSANALPRDVERALKAGFFRHLTKPLRLAEFSETLRLALEVA
jgi:signal transduction histidine kinase